MSAPRLTFFCELESGDLPGFFTGQVISDLSALGASVSLGILNRSRERAETVRRLNEAGIPVTAWLLLPREQGYWFNAGNVRQAEACYQQLKAWTAENDLHWAAVGLDIEPDVADMELLGESKPRWLLKAAGRLADRGRLRQAEKGYAQLVNAMRADGYTVESYQFPFIADERRARSTLIRRAAGLVDVPADREVWMLYTSYFRPKGAGFLWSYAPDAQAIGLGSTGGGVDTGIGDSRPLSWEELARDLRLAWHWNDRLYLFSLEGCVRQGFLPRLREFTWDQPLLTPDDAAVGWDSLRAWLTPALWAGSHLTIIALWLAGVLLLIAGLRRRRKKR